ncbi:tyrosine-type recombinase/integrase [Methylomicrobium lacus]|uniref:tyrosine-type recombinase/integrase n=1 Tax=Methylomicrobium lacus TaxID=136992 RepID=UPI00045E8355|nr:site-specific integrase [Methylomicrobium lacus]
MYVIVDETGQLLWHVNLFLADLAIGHSLNSCRAYAADLLSFLKVIRSIGDWREITPRQMTGYLHGELFQARSYSPETMAHHITTLKSFYEWQVQKGYLDAMPDFHWSYRHLYDKEAPENTVYVASQHSFHSLYIDRETFDKLKAGVVGRDPFIRARDRIALRLGYECGTRGFEVLKLNANDVRQKINEAKDRNKGLWGTAKIKIKGKGGKNRDLYLPPDLCESIMDYMKRWRIRINGGQGPLLCRKDGYPIKNDQYASSVFSDAYKTAALCRNVRQGYHRLRKSFGTHLVDECYKTGRDPWVIVPRRLGHNDIETTKRYIQFDALLHGRNHVLSELDMMANKYHSIQTRKIG